MTIVGAATDWLRPLFAGDPEIHARFVTVSGYAPEKDASTTPQSGDREDLVVFDRWAPREPPVNSALMIAPPVETPWLAGGLSAPAVFRDRCGKQPPVGGCRAASDRSRRRLAHVGRRRRHAPTVHRRSCRWPSPLRGRRSSTLTTDGAGAWSSSRSDPTNRTWRQLLRSPS